MKTQRQVSKEKVEDRGIDDILQKTANNKHGWGHAESNIRTTN